MLNRLFKKQDDHASLATSPWGEVKTSLLKDPRAIVGLSFIAVLILTAIFAGFLTPYGVLEQNLAGSLQSPSWSNWMGTDELGRDVFTRVLYGTRTSLLIGVSAVAIALAIGGTLGLVSGYFKGSVDIIIMRLMDVLLSIPAILLAIAIVASFGSGMVNLIIAISIGSIPRFARIIRSSVLRVTELQFIEASHALGSKDIRIIIKHIIPNVLSPMIVQSSIGIAVAILSAAGLGFIGLGLEASTAEWGLMLSYGRAYIRTHTYLTIFPGLAIMLTILAFNMVGDALRDAFDPKMRER